MKSTANNPDSLPDFIDYNLDCLSIGLNPSLMSVKQGFYFANPRNRFWSAFNQSDIINETLQPSVSSHEILLDRYRIGFTDVVKRASRMGHELRAIDYRRESPQLRDKIEKFKPKILWFHGKMAASNYFKYAYKYKDPLTWGWNQLSLVGPIKVFITPNPSPANAKYSLQDLVSHYNQISEGLLI